MKNIKKDIFKVVLDLSNSIDNANWHIEKLMEALLKDTEADLNQLHQDLYFFTKLFRFLDKGRAYNLRQIRTGYLEDIYGKLYIYDKE